MQFFDLHIHSAFSQGESSIEQLAQTAKELGYKGICFEEYYKNEQQIKKLVDKIAKVEKKVGIKVLLGFEARSTKELDTLRQKRRMFDLLLVHGGDLKLNRAACETPQVDILTHPEFGRNDSGLNHVLVKAAAKNNVAIEVNFREIFMATKKSRTRIMSNIEQNIRLAKKLKAPIVLCSGAISHWEMKDPQIIMSMAVQLGLELKEAKNAITKVPEKIIKQSEKRKDDKWIMPGVRVK